MPPSPGGTRRADARRSRGASARDDRFGQPRVLETAAGEHHRQRARARAAAPHDRRRSPRRACCGSAPRSIDAGTPAQQVARRRRAPSAADRSSMAPALSSIDEAVAAASRADRRHCSTRARSGLRSATSDAPSTSAPKRVEVAADAVRQRRVQAAREHLPDDVEIVRRDSRKQRRAIERRVAVERVVEQRQRDAPRLRGSPRRRRRARIGRNVATRSNRLVAARSAPRRPTPCRRCRSRCRRRPRRSPGRQPVLGHRADDVRVMVLDADLAAARAAPARSASTGSRDAGRARRPRA